MASRVETQGTEHSAAVGRTFFDSNVLVYAEDTAHPEKQQRAIRLIVEHRRRGSGVVSLQVLGEYFSAVTRKLHLDPLLARSQVEFHSRFYLVQPTLADVLAAVDLHRQHGIPYWDALIVRCASAAGCTILLTEDLQAGRVIDGLTIVNPFH